MNATAEMPTRFRLQELLEAAGMSQSELSRRSEVSVVTINAMANQRTTRVDLSTLDAISRVLGCEPGDLLERDKKRPKK
jgi:putative transcriptional regulator